MKHLGRGIYIKMSTTILTDADTIGHARQRSSDIVGGRKPGNGLRTNDPLALNISGIRGEATFHRYWPELIWHKYKDAPRGGLEGLPDFEDPGIIAIDVKTVEIKNRGREILHCPDASIVKDWFYVLVAPQDEEYFWIAGWASGAEMKAAPLRFERPSHCIEWQRLHSMHKLKALWQRRKELIAERAIRQQEATA